MDSDFPKSKKDPHASRNISVDKKHRIKSNAVRRRPDRVKEEQSILKKEDRALCANHPTSNYVSTILRCI